MSQVYINPPVAKLATGGDWYLLKTKPRSETIAQNTLKEHQITSYLPRYYFRKRGKRELESTPLFPGYLFFQLEYTSRLWGFIRWAPGIAYVLKNDSGPMCLPDKLISEIQLREEKNIQKVETDILRPFEPNEPLKIVDGPFAGLDAIYESSLSATNRVRVLVEIVGRLTRVALDTTSLNRVS